jgi:hypothetical protein
MKKREVLYHECIERDKKFLEDHNTEFSTKTSYAPLKTRFNDKYNELQKATQVQFEETDHITFDKQVLRKLAVDGVFTWVDAAYFQAEELDKPDLAKALDRDPAWLERCSENVFIGRAKDLANFLSANAGTLTVITPAAVTAMNTAIQNFEAMAAMPKKIIKTKKAQGTDIIPQLFKDFKVIRKLLKKFIRNNFSMYLSSWKGINKIGKSPGTRRLSVAAKFVDNEANTPIINVKATFTKGPLTDVKISTKLGWVRCYSLEVGTWTMDVENVMYESVKIENIGVDDGHVEWIEVKLVKKAGV